EQYTPKEEELMELDLTLDDVRGRRFFRGRGCDNCNNSGYKGRMAIFELLAMDDDLRDMIMKESSLNALRHAAKGKGMRSLRDSGLMALYEGLTTIDEVVRETLAEED